MALDGIKRKKKRLEFLSVFVCWCGRSAIKQIIDYGLLVSI